MHHLREDEEWDCVSAQIPSNASSLDFELGGAQRHCKFQEYQNFYQQKKIKWH